MIKSVYDNRFVQIGAKLFPYKKYIYALPILLLAVRSGDLFYPFGSHTYDEIFEVSGLIVALVGACLRAWASGTTRRHVQRVRRRGCFGYSDRGVFSLMRNPYFAGDLLIVAGLSIPLFDIISFSLSLSVFIMIYLPILFAEETILLYSHGAKYRAYRDRVRLIVPNFKNWIPSRSRFRFFLALRKEGNVLGLVGILYFAIEQIRDIAISGQWDQSPLWLAILLPFAALFLMLRFLDRSFDDYPEFPASPDQD